MRPGGQGSPGGPVQSQAPGLMSGAMSGRLSAGFRVRIPAASLLLLLALLAAACEHPLGVVTPHVEAADILVADSTGAVLTRTQFNRTWSVDSLTLRDGLPLRIILTPLDFRGSPIEIGERRDLSWRMEAESGALIQWEPQRGFGWLRPFGTGSTRIRFLIWHDTHADFVTPWLRVTIDPTAPGGSTPAAPSPTHHRPQELTP